VPIASSEYPLPARRPRNSVLSNAKLNTRIGIALPDWSSALELCLQQD
jgi:dTDP-4-dehydrorhamnose reductase